MDFVSFDPNAEVRAANVRATLDAFRLRPELGRELVEKHELSIHDLLPDRFILVQKWLDALQDIQAEVGRAKLREVGRAIVENADIPDQDTEALLLDLDAIYYRNHRGDVGHYRSRRKANGVIEVRCETPYPRDFEWGLIEGFCTCARGKRYQIEYIDGPRTGSLTCTLLIHPLR